jgi:uncharacterized lipoprotein YmbA
MTKRLLTILTASLLLTGCIVFDKKSESVTFHQLAAPQATPTVKGPLLFIPRVTLPSSVRRPTLVLIDEANNVQVEDSQRWATPLDRGLAEALGQHLVKNTGRPVTNQAPGESHLVLLIDVDQFALNHGTAVLQLRFRVENDAGHLLAEGQGTWNSPKAEKPEDFVRAQSENLAKAALIIGKVLAPLTTKSGPPR